MAEDPARQQEMLQELAALEAQGRARRQRLARTLRLGSLVVAASFLFLLRGDLLYWTRPAEPVNLGGPLEFDLSHEQSQRYAKVVAVPGGQAANVSYMGKQLRLFGLLGTNILVVQDLSRTSVEESPTRGAPFSVQGRLVRDDDASQLRSVFSLMEMNGTLARQDGHLYALWAGEAPREGWGLPLELLGIALFVVVNFHAARRTERNFADEAEGDGASTGAS